MDTSTQETVMHHMILMQQVSSLIYACGWGDALWWTPIVEDDVPMIKIAACLDHTGEAQRALMRCWTELDAGYFVTDPERPPVVTSLLSPDGFLRVRFR